ncbi:hypothetical protein [Mesorhizobium sp. STM 4661]|uniref:hypothetical protein n=1 Tax=Mesorhizobium sp. STM 4661 TaxID=1297570 RepID=UPI0012F97D4F|nr:hypothetical protein [Mesorhizobium sp. STM 4661]
MTDCVLHRMFLMPPLHLQRLECRLIYEDFGGGHGRDPAGCRLEISSADPPATGLQCQEALEIAAAQFDLQSHLRMASGADHDAEVLAGKIEAGMHFTPCMVIKLLDRNADYAEISLSAECGRHGAAGILARRDIAIREQP